MMAHEIAHVAARHGTRQATRGEIAAARHYSADLHGRLGRRTASQACQPRGPDRLPAVLQGLRSRKPTCSACNICTRPATIRTAFVDFFEKIQTLEKKKPGTMAKVFSTHPPTDDRIKKAQEEIQQSEGEAGIRGDHVRIQRCQAAAGDARESAAAGQDH